MIFETDTSTLIHIPNHVEADILRIDDDLTHDYDECLRNKISFNGYGCEDKFCDWLFSDQNYNSTVMAHNGSGYDFKIILKWCLQRGMTPDNYIRQGSHIMYMSFRKFRLRFVDSCIFFRTAEMLIRNVFYRYY